MSDIPQGPDASREPTDGELDAAASDSAETAAADDQPVALSGMEGRVEEIDLNDEIQRSYLDYAMSVIVGRALPDVRDGLKPVHLSLIHI